VGAQSSACAQSIACGDIGDNICQKNKIIEKLCYTRKEGVIQQQILEQKNHFFSFKSGK
jgi:hypothetical protein